MKIEGLTIEKFDSHALTNAFLRSVNGGTATERICGCESGGPDLINDCGDTTFSDGSIDNDTIHDGITMQ